MKRLFALLFVLFCSPVFASGVEVLPVGSAPQALEFSWFPNRTCAVIWRTWNLVEVETIADVLGTEPAQVLTLAQKLGLPEYRKPTWSRAQIYITLVRATWHLLPYEQILPLTGMTAEELAFHLREDDFLFIKLGRLKPKCEPVRFEEPDPAKLAAWREAVGTEYSAFTGTETISWCTKTRRTAPAPSATAAPTRPTL